MCSTIITTFVFSSISNEWEQTLYNVYDNKLKASIPWLEFKRVTLNFWKRNEIKVMITSGPTFLFSFSYFGIKYTKS